MPNTVQGAKEPFIEVDYAAKVVFTSKREGAGRQDLRAAWQQSQGLWRNHPIFHGMSISTVIVWLRGEDSDV
jgi:hypothetical protein